ncbi:MAG: methylaspartate ammonia-lyase [Candidatus Izemoplasmatales bacterium]|uniref:methylaspartate ammonia-lyase n=1 Tax=Hujiaoplasma nucleasis TaxID=2725268 RepID=A0A7L6N7M0_9MOLU|nr:methylaspartate ammonia-lyase [Hujiaoplasma nucleasis]QLY40539.1 methylaspartate ammonia-lyase [Hujiaoplasma nucleasis]
MKIKDVILSKAYTGFFFDDQKAIKAGAKKDGLFYVGQPLIDGFKSIRQKGEAISIQLVLENGDTGIGECAAVQYSGTGGRDPLFLADDYIPFIEEHITPLLIGQELSDFKSMAEKYDRLKINGQRLHTAIRYGLTQAILSAISVWKKSTMAEIVRESYHINDEVYQAVPIFTQSGDERYDGVDKMILKEADVIPHGLINNIDEKLGRQGELLKNYVEWMRNRVLKYRAREDYLPVIHVDVYGTIGIAFNNDLERIVEYLIDLEETAKPLKIRVEGPIDDGSKEGTINYLAKITQMLDERESKLEIVADEWCNTLEDIKDFADAKAGHMLQIKTPDLGGINNICEAIIYCNKVGIGSYSGGTCNETNISSQITTNIAIACKADQMLAKPGMGVDEGYMIVKNEMNRVLAKANRKKG